MAKSPTRWLDRRISCPGPFLMLCLSQDELDQAVKRLKIPGFPWLGAGAAATAHLIHCPAGLTCIVCVGDVSGRSGIEVAGLLVHEAVHVWQAWCRDIGEERPGDEQEAYGVQAIAQELMAEYARRLHAGYPR